jgi:hypothetical protein
MNVPDGNALMNKVEINLDMIGVLVLDGVGGEVDGADVVTVDQSGPWQGLYSSTSSWRSQHTSITPLATTRYSTLALEREMTF